MSTGLTLGHLLSDQGIDSIAEPTRRPCPSYARSTARVDGVGVLIVREVDRPERFGHVERVADIRQLLDVELQDSAGSPDARSTASCTARSCRGLKSIAFSPRMTRAISAASATYRVNFGNDSAW